MLPPIADGYPLESPDAIRGRIRSRKAIAPPIPPSAAVRCKSSSRGGRGAASAAQYSQASARNTRQNGRRKMAWGSLGIGSLETDIDVAEYIRKAVHARVRIPVLRFRSYRRASRTGAFPIFQEP